MLSRRCLSSIRRCSFARCSLPANFPEFGRSIQEDSAPTSTRRPRWRENAQRCVRTTTRTKRRISPRGRRTLAREGGQGKKITVSRLFPRKSRWPNSLGTLSERFGTETCRGTAEPRAEVVEARLAARYEICSDGSSLDIADKIIGGSNGVHREIDSDGLRRASLGKSLRPFRFSRRGLSTAPLSLP